MKLPKAITLEDLISLLMENGLATYRSILSVASYQYKQEFQFDEVTRNGEYKSVKYLGRYIGRDVTELLKSKQRFQYVREVSVNISESGGITIVVDIDKAESKCLWFVKSNFDRYIESIQILSRFNDKYINI